MKQVSVYAGGSLGDYNFGHNHPFGPARHSAFLQHFRQLGLAQHCGLLPPVMADRKVIERFHTPAYIEQVQQQSASGQGYLDYGDTPAFPGVYEASARVVGTVVQAIDDLMHGVSRRAFVPIAGLHHARREAAAGFCVFNDCGVAIETLRQVYTIPCVAYVDIDAHHGDGVFYAFEADPAVVCADIHEDGRYLYPGTGRQEEVGVGAAQGHKLNIPLPPGAGDSQFFQAWDVLEAFLDGFKPQFILLQCGADSLAGDPITHLAYSSKAHRYATERLCSLADQYAEGRLLALGGGGYNLENLASAWCAVVQAMLDTTAQDT